ncbi:MAG: FAD-binding oxidoreductase [Chitinophagaceae bacterium]|nr:FAD-binding oxidoreductase [Chitinophagaceae bacterium]
MKRSEFIRFNLLGSIGLLLKPITSFAVKEVQDVMYLSASNPDYNNIRRGFNTRINKFPKVVAVCYSEAGVVKAVQFARQQNLPISIKSGGHCMEGFSTGEGSVQLVLSNLNKIVWIDDFTIQVGPGVLLKNLYETMIPKGKILPGGSCATVAIGGLCLGGGYGLMSRLFGLTCDSLLSVSMVDGKAQLVSTKQDAELLWACRGGGNGNFGVITSMTFKVHNRPKVMSSYRFRSYKTDKKRAASLLSEWMNQCKKLPKSCFSTCLFNGDTVYILLTNVSASKPEVQLFITTMKKLSDKTTMNLNQPLGTALQNYYGQPHPVKFKNASAGLYNQFSEVQPFLDAALEKVFTTRGMIFQFNTLGGFIQDSTLESQSSFPHRNYLFFTELQTYWDDEKQGALCLQRFEEVQQLIAATGVKAQYRNYPDINFKNPLALYYGKNLVRLKAIKAKYDPENRIRHEQSIGLL